MFLEPGILCLLFVPVAIGIAIAFRLLAGNLDHWRIRDYVVARGGRIIDMRWAPFGPGWFGANKERIYAVRYRDHEGSIHAAFARTNLWSGVYFTEDAIIEHAKPFADDEAIESLEEENRRLREELARLKRKERDPQSDAIEE